MTEETFTQITRIKPAHSRLSLNLKEIWAYRELLYFLTWRDVKIRYKQTAIGIGWTILQPILTTAIFTVIFSTFARFDTAAIPYSLFALSGLMIWLFVHNAITIASNGFVNNANLVTKVYFPRLIVPLAATLAGVIDLFFSFLILIILMLYYGISLTWQILWVPVFVLLAIVQAVALGTLFSALNVRFRDVKFALPFVLQVWMIASPIFYPQSLVPEKWKLIFAVNPLTGILEGFRSALFGTPADWALIGVSLISVFLCVAVSLFVFKQMEDDFADLI